MKFNFFCCQSCGMPLDQDPNGRWWWTEQDGSISTLYCSLCYIDGSFVRWDCTVWQMQDIVETAMHKKWYNRLFCKIARWQIPTLMRRKQNKTLRFVRKTYGRWRTPATPQWWLTMILYIWYIIRQMTRFQDTYQNSYTINDVLIHAIWPTMIATVTMILICYQKWESPKRQRWNNKS